MHCTKKKDRSGDRLREKANEEMSKKAPLGLTFIELLIVTAMIAVISLTMYSVLSNGIKIWVRVNTALPEEDLNIFFDKFSADLRNSFRFTGIDFFGTESRLEFATLVDSPRLNNKTVGKITYSYDRNAKTLSKESRDFSQVYEEGEVEGRVLLKDIDNLSFSYYLYDEQRKKYLWADEWLEKRLPLAVRVVLEYRNGKEINKFIKTVNIPSAD